MPTCRSFKGIINFIITPFSFVRYNPTSNQIPVLLTFLLVFISCGKDEKEKETDEKSDSKNFELTIKYKYNLNDTFKVFYSKDKNAPIDGSLEIAMQVFGADDFQETTFVFPTNDFPKVIRLDVGNNQDAESIEIKNIKLTHGDVIIDNSDFVNTMNWSSNESLVVDEKNKGLYKIVAQKVFSTCPFIYQLTWKTRRKLAKISPDLLVAGVDTTLTRP